MNYALIENGVVVNIIYLHPMNVEDFPNAVPFDGYPVAAGDTYIDGVFYHDGIALKTVSEMLSEENADMRSALNELGVTVNG